ncbi:hypothetical protein DV738_g2412, partial [Chaetothyriales sp. CBS 135597]
MLNSLGRHENIVSILGSDAIKREITLSYESGQSLDKFVDRQFVSTLTDMDCQHIWRGLAGALSWIHDQGKLYNDLKPSNTMFDPRLRKAVLIDFGLASDKLERSFSTGGTPWYVAPEYLLRQRSYASDVWSLGVLMLFALGLLKLPDETEQSWKLNQVLDEESPESTKMIMWIRKVSRTKNAIPARWEVLRRVLEERASKRIRSSELLSGETNKIALLIMAPIVNTALNTVFIVRPDGQDLVEEDLPGRGRAVWVRLPLCAPRLVVSGTLERNAQGQDVEGAVQSGLPGIAFGSVLSTMAASSSSFRTRNRRHQIATPSPGCSESNASIGRAVSEHDERERSPTPSTPTATLSPSPPPTRNTAIHWNDDSGHYHHGYQPTAAESIASALQASARAHPSNSTSYNSSADDTQETMLMHAMGFLPPPVRGRARDRRWV